MDKITLFLINLSDLIFKNNRTMIFALILSALLVVGIFNKMRKFVTFIAVVLVATFIYSHFII